MDLKATLAQRLLIPTYERRWGVHSGSLLQSLQKSERESHEQIRERQWAKLKSLLEFVHSANPFYRDRFDAIGLKPGDLGGFEQLDSIPILSKDDLRENADALIEEMVAKLNEWPVSA